jgi:hypothetical protein
MPESKFGDQTIIIPPGKPRIVQLTPRPITLIIQTPATHAVAVVRHWSDEKKGTEVCRCSSPCATSRQDTFVSALEWVGPMTWEQHLWAMSDAALAQIWRLVRMKTQTSDFRGAGLAVRRHGDRANGRVLVEWLHHNKDIPPGFDVAHAVLVCTGIAADFFGDVVGEPIVPNIDQVITPIRARADKPRVPLGKR